MNDASLNEVRPLDIAIIGLAGRFPGARTVGEFWENLRNGVESITSFSDEDLQRQGIRRHVDTDPTYVKRAPLLDAADQFDADFFNIPPTEAKFLDPQQRIFLECALETLEDAGYDPWRCRESIGVYAGAGVSTYPMALLRENSEQLRDSGVLRTMAVVGNDKDYLATRVSYKLDLKGPSVSIQTACPPRWWRSIWPLRAC